MDTVAVAPAPKPAPPPPPAPAKPALEALTSDYQYNAETTDTWCKQEWEKRGVLDKQMYGHCMRTEKSAHQDLVALVKKHSELKWIDGLLPKIWEQWTKRGLTQYSMVNHGLKGEIEGYLDLQYERSQATYNEAKMAGCVEQWQSHTSPWTMAMHCYKQE